MDLIKLFASDIGLSR